jgi:hypothetical protein
LLDWEPRIPLDEGLRVTCAFFAGEICARHAEHGGTRAGLLLSSPLRTPLAAE